MMFKREDSNPENQADTAGNIGAGPAQAANVPETASDADGKSGHAEAESTAVLPRLKLPLRLRHGDGPAFPDPSTLDEEDAAAYARLKEQRALRRKRTMKRRAIVLGVIAAVTAAGAFGVHMLTQEPETTVEAITDVAFAGTYTNSVDARGSLEPLSSTVVTPSVDGTIAEVHVAAGQKVAAGDTLMVISNPDLDAAVNDAKRSLQAAQEEHAAAKRALADAQNASGATSTGNPEEPEPVVDVAGAKDAVAAAWRAVEGAQAAYDQAVARAGERTVRAPISGDVVTMNAQVGASPQGGADTSGSSGPLMQIADLSQMKVTIQVSEEDIAHIAVGQTAAVTFPAFDDITLDGTVQNIASIATGGMDMGYMGDGSSVTFAVDVLIPHPDPRLKPGMTAQVTITTLSLENVVMVPSMALMSDDGSSYYVMVETDPETHAAERVDVEVAVQDNSLAVVGRQEGSPAPEGMDLPLSPVSDGQVLVISGGSMDMGVMP